MNTDDLTADLIFPPEFHRACKIKETENEVRIVVYGGQYRESESITKTVNDLVIYTFRWDDSSCWQESTKRLKPIRHWVKAQSKDIYRGSWMPRLSNSSSVYSKDILTVWGGLLIDENLPSSDMYMFSGLHSDNNVVDSTLFPGPETLKRAGVDLDSGSNYRNGVQTGVIPTRRSGHTLSLVEETYAVLVGGLTFSSEGPRLVKKHPADNVVLLDLSRQHWFSLDVNGNKSVFQRVYHATSSRDGVIVISGGCYFQEGKMGKRLNALCFTKCLVNTDKKQIVVVSAVDCTNDRPLVHQFLSQHSVTRKDDTLFIFGGLSGETGKGELVSQLLKVNLTSQTSTSLPIPSHLKRSTKVCGVSSHWLGLSTLLILGGSKPELGGRSNFMYTTLSMTPKSCDFKKKCIVDINFCGDLKMVGCDVCRGWFHICCDDKLDPLKLP